MLISACILSGNDNNEDFEQRLVKIERCEKKAKIKIMNEKVAIIIPVYNSSEFLGECIESVIAQTYKI